MAHHWSKRLAGGMAGLLLLGGMHVPSAAAKTPVLVSMGDSYSSGEGMEPFYGHDLPDEEKIQNADFLAHRSELSWCGRLTLPGVEGTLADHRGENWYFVAASGALTENITQPQEKTYDRRGLFSTVGLAPQTDIFDTIGKGCADYVTVTIGGNDMGFADIVTTAYSPATSPDTVRAKLDSVWDNFYFAGGIRDSIRQSYRAIADAAGEQAVIIVAGYPRLLAPEGSADFSAENSQLVDEAVDRFNDELEALVQECRDEGMQICFASVREEFEGHEAYAKKAYLNGVMLFAREQELKTGLVSKYSMHPNVLGSLAYARAVQRVLDGLAKRPGDVNADGVFDVQDAAVFSGWLHAAPGVTLAAPEAGDLCGDGVLDVYDLCLMKRQLADG